MIVDPYVPTPPAIDHPKQTGLAALFALLLQPKLTPLRDNRRHARAGITTNKMQPRNKARARMARESRRRNRG